MASGRCLASVSSLFRLLLLCGSQPSAFPSSSSYGAAPSSSRSSEPQKLDTWSNRSRPAAWASLWPALIAACIALFHFKESTEKPVPGRQQKVKTQLTPIRALSQAPREVMKYGSGEICNALLSGLGYNGVHANYACRLPPAPGRRTTQRAPGLRPGLAEERRREEGAGRSAGETRGVVCGGEGGAHVEEEGAQGKRERVGGRSGTQGGVKRKWGEEHREEGEPGGRQRTKGIGG